MYTAHSIDLPMIKELNMRTRYLWLVVGLALCFTVPAYSQGILIWDKEPPPDSYPRIGIIASANSVLPLIGIRVSWASVNSERCPLFANLDSLTQ